MKGKVFVAHVRRIMIRSPYPLDLIVHILHPSMGGGGQTDCLECTGQPGEPIGGFWA